MFKVWWNAGTPFIILSNVLLKAENGELALTATDMDLEIVETVPAEVTQAGSTTAPAHTLYDIVRKLPDGSQVELDSSGDNGLLTLRSGRSNFKLGCLPTEDFPQMSGGDLAHRFSLSASDLRMLVDRTRFAISTEETRYYLNGIYLHATCSRAGETKCRCCAPSLPTATVWRGSKSRCPKGRGTSA